MTIEAEAKLTAEERHAIEDRVGVASGILSTAIAAAATVKALRVCEVKIRELEDALQWALNEGGWQLMYYTSEHPACIESRPIGEPGQVRRMFPKPSDIRKSLQS